MSCAASRWAVRPSATSGEAVDLLAQRLVLILGVDRVADPADQVASGLSAAGAGLDRSEGLLGAALQGVEEAAPDSPK